jgi:hypothetical protein
MPRYTKETIRKGMMLHGGAHPADEDLVRRSASREEPDNEDLKRRMQAFQLKLAALQKLVRQ